MKEYGKDDIDKFNRAAEEHMRRMDISWMTHKPLESAFNAPANLFRVGNLLSIARIGFHTVLDFGAGACWLSSLLNRLNVKTISLDVSQTALNAGMDHFASDRSHRSEIASFMTYDGITIPLADKSVDRVLAFDSFHHIPNPKRILGEIFRVLTPGGIFAMSEPGVEHSKSDDAKRETRDFGTLEQDIDVDDLVKTATAAGFGPVNVSLFTMPEAGTLTYDEYKSFRSYNDSILTGKMKGFAKYHTVVALHKGQSVVDSRLPGKLLAEIKLVDAPKQARAGEKLRYKFRVTNRGDTVWLMNADHLGVVRIGAHLKHPTGVVADWDYSRGVAAADVRPGETAEFPIEIAAPKAGNWRISFDMVDEGVTWFSQEPGNKECELALDVL